MLTCHVNPSLIPLECNNCHICQARSKLDYPFNKNLSDSDGLVAEIMNFVTVRTGYRCKRTTVHKNPDIDVYDNTGRIICRIEAKYLEGYAFMKSLQQVNLFPRETLVVDSPKLDSYIQRKAADLAAGNNIPIFVVWKFDRPCRDIGGIAVFEEIDALNAIRCQYPERSFERKSAFNDYRYGNKLGITSKYHYSIRECKPIGDLPAMISAL